MTRCQDPDHVLPLCSVATHPGSLHRPPSTALTPATPLTCWWATRYWLLSQVARRRPTCCGAPGERRRLAYRQSSTAAATARAAVERFPRVPELISTSTSPSTLVLAPASTPGPTAAAAGVVLPPSCRRDCHLWFSFLFRLHFHLRLHLHLRLRLSHRSPPPPLSLHCGLPSQPVLRQQRRGPGPRLMGVKAKPKGSGQFQNPARPS